MSGADQVHGNSLMTQSELIKDCALVIGASSGIAKALITQLRHECPVIAISRRLGHDVDPKHHGRGEAIHSPSRHHSGHHSLEYYRCDNSDSAIAGIIATLMSRQVRVTRVYIFNGVLHQAGLSPEKRLEEISAESMQTLFHINSVIPMLWLKHLLPLVKGQTPCVVTVLSARIASISDNRLGGWYSYRASKAALNMLLQTAAVEYARRAKNVALLAFHPGTTDTELSKPFQHNVAKEKLFTTEFVSQRLLKVSTGLAPSSHAYFIDWDGKAISW